MVIRRSPLLLLQKKLRQIRGNVNRSEMACRYVSSAFSYKFIFIVTIFHNNNDGK